MSTHRKWSTQGITKNIPGPWKHPHVSPRIHLEGTNLGPSFSESSQSEDDRSLVLLHHLQTDINILNSTPVSALFVSV